MAPGEDERRRKLLRGARRGDRGARERLVISHLGLVRSVASRYRDLGLPFDDLVQEGSLGLLDAIDHYDPCRGPEFDSYARFRVRRAIRNALTDQARLIRLPKQVVERRRAIDRAEAKLTAAPPAAHRRQRSSPPPPVCQSPRCSRRARPSSRRSRSTNRSCPTALPSKAWSPTRQRATRGSRRSSTSRLSC